MGPPPLYVVVELPWYVAVFEYGIAVTVPDE